MQYVKLLSELSREDLPLAGGKGANLGALVKAGLPVPPGFCLITGAYQRFVEENGLQERILGLLDETQLDQLDSLEAASAEIRSLFTEGRLPEAIAAEVCEAYARMSRDSIARGDEALPVAVRSSATAEDLPDLSFAGQQDTYLNVTGEQPLLYSIVQCWSSLWTARAIGYRARNQIRQDEVALAVVVQQMVQSEASGVLFTANPLTGKRAETVIDATLGLGEALVSGMVEPDHYVVDADAGWILDKTLGAKALSIRGASGGGTRQIEEDAAAVQALPDESILALAEFGKQSAAYFGTPQDMEWAWAGGRLYVLQSRPITSLHPLPEGIPALPLKVFFSFAAWQGMLDPVSPLGQDAFGSLITGIGRNFGSRMTLRNQSILLPAGERLFINLTGLFHFPAGRKFLDIFVTAIDPASRQVFEDLLNEPRLAAQANGMKLADRLRLIRTIFPIAAGVFYNLLFPRQGRERLSRQIERNLQGAQEKIQAAADSKSLIRVIEELFNALPGKWIPSLLPGVIAGQAPLQILLRLSSSLPEGPQTVMELTRGLPHNVTTEMDLALWATAQAIRQDASAQAYFAQHQAQTLADEYLAGALPAAAQAAVRRFLAVYGMRGVAEIDLFRIRWNEDPVHIFQVLKSYLEFGEENLSPEAVFRNGAIKAQSAQQTLVAAFRKTRMGWLKARLVRAFAFRIRELTGLRETPKFTIIRLFGMIRSALQAAGRKWVDQGVFDRVDDIFFLHIWELKELADDRLENPRELVNQRRQVYARELARRRIPRLILSDGTTIYEGVHPGAAEGEDTLSGSPVSAGVVEGRVHVIIDPHGAQLMPGEILVCPATDPAWTPLFLSAGGLVMEIGGMMTHGSVVAREYGIPAVVGVRQVTTRLKTGQHVRVDGGTGIITVLQDEAAT